MSNHGWGNPNDPPKPLPPDHEVFGGRAGECPRYVEVAAYRWTALRLGRPMPRPGLTALFRRGYETEDHFNARILLAVDQRKLKIFAAKPGIAYSLPIPVYCHYDDKTPAQWAREYRIERLFEKAVSPTRSPEQRVASLCTLADLLGMSKPQTDVPLTEEQAEAFAAYLRSHRALN
jgi:hypothetical protein